MKRVMNQVSKLTVLVLMVWSVLGLQAEGQDRKIGTCGPPPRKNPERQTAAEGMPPLPLPVTPMRRSESKSEPAPPIMLAKLEYGTTQDWNTDPGDVDNLMRHCRYQLGLWYGFKNLPIADLVAQHKAGEHSPIPLLYVSGHDAFEFTDEQRAAIRQYVIDGGTILGDACCGQPAFAAAFRKEVLKMFPDRSFDILEVDHPIYHAFYPYANSHYVNYDGAARNEFQGPPQLLGMNIGCRTAVILTPEDMSCGWDEHLHDRGSRYLPGDAVRLGVNLLSYVAAERPLGEAQAVTREIHAATDRPREHLFFAQVRHQGDWNPDPNSIYQMLRQVALESSLSVEFDLKQVDAHESELAPYPFLYLTGHRDPKFSDAEVSALRNHLQAGGFLLVNNCCGRSVFDQQVRALVKRMFPDQEMTKVAADHPLLRSFHTIAEVRDRLSGAPRPLELEGISIKDRLVLVYSKNDMLTDLKQVSDPYGNGYDAASCRLLALNVVAYAMQN